MKSVNIEIDGNIYPIKFGFGANLIMANKWGLKTFGEVGGHLAKVFQFKDGVEPTMEQLSSLGEFILSGILNVTPDAVVDANDVVDSIMNDIGPVSKIITLYGDSLPKTPPKSKNVKRGQKK